MSTANNPIKKPCAKCGSSKRKITYYPQGAAYSPYTAFGLALSTDVNRMALEERAMTHYLKPAPKEEAGAEDAADSEILTLPAVKSDVLTMDVLLVQCDCCGFAWTEAPLDSRREGESW